MAYSGAPPGPTLGAVISQLQVCGVVFSLVVLFLMSWGIFLGMRLRPLSEYLAFIAASFLPLLLGILGGARSLCRALYDLGNNGMAHPDGPAALANDLGQILVQLIYGSLCSCLFLSLGVLVLIVRHPR